MFFIGAQAKSRLIGLIGEFTAIRQQIRKVTALRWSQRATQRVDSPLRWYAWSTKSVEKCVGRPG